MENDFGLFRIFFSLEPVFCSFISGHSFVSRFCSVYVIGARSAQRCAEWTPLDSFFSLSKCALCASVAEFGFQNVYAYVSSMVSEWLWLLFFFVKSHMWKDAFAGSEFVGSHKFKFTTFVRRVHVYKFVFVVMCGHHTTYIGRGRFLVGVSHVSCFELHVQINANRELR